MNDFSLFLREVDVGDSKIFAFMELYQIYHRSSQDSKDF